MRSLIEDDQQTNDTDQEIGASASLTTTTTTLFWDALNSPSHDEYHEDIPCPQPGACTISGDVSNEVIFSSYGSTYCIPLRLCLVENELDNRGHGN